MDSKIDSGERGGTKKPKCSFGDISSRQKMAAKTTSPKGEIMPVENRRVRD